MIDHTSTKRRLSSKAAIAFGLLLVSMVGVAAVLTPMQNAFAHGDPITNCPNSVDLDFQVFEVGTSTAIGFAEVGDVIDYEATLNNGGAGTCAFEAGTLTITTPDGVDHIVASGSEIPLIGGNLGVASQTFPRVNYTVSENDLQNILGTLRVGATADYANGTSHRGTVHDVAAASLTISVTIVPSISWLKHDDQGALLGGAIFSVTPDPYTGTGSLNVTDNQAPDADSDDGEFLLLSNVTDQENPILIQPGNYTIVELSAPSGYDPDGTQCTVTVDENDVNPSCEDPFVNTPIVGNISWLKHDDQGALLGGATFSVTPDPYTGTGSLNVTDNDSNDADPDNGEFLLANITFANFGNFTIVEVAAPDGYTGTDVQCVVELSIENLTASCEDPFVNTPAGEGKTPGFWKTHPELWDHTDNNLKFDKNGFNGDNPALLNYFTTDSFNAIFGTNLPNNPTLLQAISTGGNSNSQALVRHCVAALLNADNPFVDYPMTAADIIDQCGEAINSPGTADDAALKDILEDFNSLEGGIDSFGRPI